MTGASLLLVLVALVVGATVPVQSGSNVMLARYAGHSLYAAFTNTAVATLALAIALFALRVTPPSASSLAQAPWWSWMGGLYGASLVLSAIVLAPRLGATTYVAATIAGTMVASLVVDHYGLIGFPRQEVSGSRIVGVLLLGAGVLLIYRR